MGHLLRNGMPGLGRVAMALALLVASVAARAQEGAGPVTVTGRVTRPGGLAAGGVVVVSSAGGQAVTSDDGGFRLRVERPASGEPLRLTAVGGAGSGGVLAHASFPPTAGDALDAGTLVLRPKAGGCEPGWLPAFGSVSGLTSFGTQAEALALAAFDDGSGGGPALYVGGRYKVAGGLFVDNLARWDGTQWSDVGGGVGVGGNSRVLALEVFDDGLGAGPKLYVGGQFESVGPITAHNVARWTGASWEAVGGGLDDSVYSFAVHDEGSGPRLFAGGSFSGHVARWTGAAWTTPGPGVGGDGNIVRALASFDDGLGGGAQLYAGGDFLFAGSVPARRIARWNGSAWSALGLGVAGAVNATQVDALAVYDDGRGGGPALYAGGEFHFAGGLPANHLARWDDLGWSPVGGGLDGPVHSLSVFDGGGGPRLHAVGQFSTAGAVAADSFAAWDGEGWTALAQSVDFAALTATVFDAGDDSGPVLVVGGQFDGIDSTDANHVAAWDGEEWSSLGQGPSGTVESLAVFDDGAGGGPALYVAGDFNGAGGLLAQGLARWDGEEWSTVGGATPFTDDVHALAVFDDGRGGGPALYAGGEFETAGGVAALRIARWDGLSWSPVGSGMDDTVTALAAYEHPVLGQRFLFAAGDFLDAGGSGAFFIARWDGESWSTAGLTNDSVFTFAVFDDGSGTGPSLYAGGRFSFLGVPAGHIARWNGSSWSALGSGLGTSSSTSVQAIAVLDDGGGDGPALYAGGDFTQAIGAPVDRIAKWDGASWSSLGEGVDGPVRGLASFDDGTGPALFVGGDFTTAGRLPASHAAKWDGSTWAPLGGGLDGSIRAFAVFDEGPGAGPKLFAGGGFATAFDTADGRLATWGGCTSALPAWTHIGFALPGIDGPPVLAGSGTLEPGSAGALVATHVAPSAFASLVVSVTSSPTAFKGGVLVPLPALLLLPLATSPAGAVTLAWANWPGGLSGMTLYLQLAIADAAAVHGVALSNALSADVP